MTTTHNTANETNDWEIAIIGMAGRFPKAKNIDAYWQNLVDGVNSIHYADEQSLLAHGYSKELIDSDKFVNASLLIDDASAFDAEFFNISAADATLMDPQIRLLLQTAWHTFEDAGYDSISYQGSVGNFCSMGSNTYLIRLAQIAPDNIKYNGLQTRILNDKDFLATQLSYRLNLKGPAMSVQTACSSSLLSVHLACQSLLNDECDMALAGGAQVDGFRTLGYSYVKGSIASPDGVCRAFDQNAQGTLAGDGVGMVLLKKHQAALDDGDHIYAVIKGSAANNDGADKMAYTAPSVNGQRDVICEALAMADVDADTVTLIEAHGTGTALGDPAEIAAITEAFRLDSDRNQYCAIGSVKSNIGHLDAAAGVAGLIKTAKCLYHGQLVPSINYEKPNPALNIEQTPFYVSQQHQAWPQIDHPRRAGISSFGVGGTNVHLVLEQATDTKVPAKSTAKGHKMIAISARNEAALKAYASQLATYLQTSSLQQGKSDIQLADIEHTLLYGRHHFSHRTSFVCDSKEQLIEQLSAYCKSDSHATYVADGHQHQGVFIYPGQGSQYVEMARGLYQQLPEFKALLDECFTVTDKYLGQSLAEVMFLSTEQQLAQTQYAQLAIFVVEYALGKLWQSFGVTPAAVVGHSLGEYAAACLCGVMSLQDGVKLVFNRANLMAQMPSGSMLAVNTNPSAIDSLLIENVEIAAINGPEKMVLSGPTEAIENQQQTLVSRGFSCKLLNTSHAFHSAMMDEMLADFSKILAQVEFKTPDPQNINFYSTVTGSKVDITKLATSEYWLEQIRKPVLFNQAIENLLATLPSSVFIEVGPGRALTSFVKRIANTTEVLTVNSLHQSTGADNEVNALYQAKGQLWQYQVNFVRPSAKRNLSAGRMISLPGYVFQTQDYWIEGEQNLTTKLEQNTLGSSVHLGVELSAIDSDANSPVISEAFLAQANDIHQSYVKAMSELAAEHQLSCQAYAPVNDSQITDTVDNQSQQNVANSAAKPMSKRTTSVAYVEPNTDTERKIASHWQSVLGYQPVGLNDNYFDVGGDSLTGTTLLAKVEKQFEINLSFEDITNAQTLKELADVVELRLWLNNNEQAKQMDESDDEVFEI